MRSCVRQSDCEVTTRTNALAHELHERLKEEAMAVTMGYAAMFEQFTPSDLLT